MAFERSVRPLDAEMKKKAKLNWIHIPLSVVMGIIMAAALYFIIYCFKQEFISGKDVMSMCTILLPLAYFVYLFRKSARLGQDKKNNLTIIFSGKVTEKEIKRVGTGKSSTHLHYLFSGEDKLVVDKWFYDQVGLGSLVEVGTLPMSEIMVLQREVPAIEKGTAHRVPKP